MSDIEKAKMLLIKALFPFLPWGIRFPDGTIIAAIYPTIENMAIQLFDHNADIVFLTNFEWTYPPEDRKGVPVWVKDGSYDWQYYCSIEAIDQAFTPTHCVAADPRNLQEPPK